MSRLVWDRPGERYFETGIQNGVLYPCTSFGVYSPGIAWNGLTGVTESPSGAEVSPLYSNDIRYLNMMSGEEFEGTIEAYTYPDEFAVCDGSVFIATGVKAGQQKRQPFGLAYTTVLGNDVNGIEYGYKLHIIYGALASPSEKSYATINDDPEAMTFSWDISTVPVDIAGINPSASIVINSKGIIPSKLKNLEDVLYGTDSSAPRLPMPNEVVRIVSDYLMDQSYDFLMDNQGNILVDHFVQNAIY